MIVTDITEASKSKSNIYIDGEFAFQLYKGELRQFNIKKDTEITSDIYNEIVGTVLTKRAKQRAMHLLEKRPYTEKALIDKLRDNSYSEEIIEEAINYLKGFNYINDLDYALQYIDTYAETKSVRRIEQDLRQKGIDKNTVEKAIAARKDEGELGDERKMIVKLLEKKHYSSETADAKEKNKMMTYLYGKGFSIENIKSVMNYDEFN